MPTLTVFSSTAAKRAALVLGLMLAVPLVASPADARAGGGFSFGSRGARTFSMPSATPTAPRAAPFERTETPALGATQPRRFGFGSGLLAGLLGAGLMGSMFGGGFFYGIAALIGLVFKFGLILALGWFVLRLFRGGSARPVAVGPRGYARSALDGAVPGGSPAAGRAGGVTPVITPQDYAAFEQALIAVQDAYSREDVAALARIATPEIVRDLQNELAANRSRGVRNDVSHSRLVKGDLSEAWTEGATNYATVAMRFAAVDVMVDRASGRIASGDPVNPVEAVELWTFRRQGGSGWFLSAIQQGG